MARKTKRRVKRKGVRRRIVKKKKVKKISYSSALMKLLGLLAVVVLIALIAMMFTIPQVELKLDQTTPPIVSGITQSGGSCKRNSECFVVSCKSGGALECVNTIQMESYYQKCEGWWDVKVENQDPSKCSCIENNCRTP